MREGLLWYDANPKRAPQSKLDDALARFVERFGHGANCCHVAPRELFDHPSVNVVPDPAVLPHHFLVGRDESLEPARHAGARAKRGVKQPVSSPSAAAQTVLPRLAETAVLERSSRPDARQSAPRRPRQISAFSASDPSTPPDRATRGRSTSRRI